MSAMSFSDMFRKHHIHTKRKISFWFSYKGIVGLLNICWIKTTSCYIFYLFVYRRLQCHRDTASTSFTAGIYLRLSKQSEFDCTRFA